MLSITHQVLNLEPEEVLELERILTDGDREGAYAFLKKAVYRKLLGSQENRLKSHLDGCADPAGSIADKRK
jgi:hypothetical protein